MIFFLQNKLTYFDLFYHFIMGRIGPKFSHLLTVRAGGADPLPPPYGQPDRKKTVFFLTTTLTLFRFFNCLFIFSKISFCPFSGIEWKDGMERGNHHQDQDSVERGGRMYLDIRNFTFWLNSPPASLKVLTLGWKSSYKSILTQFCLQNGTM